MLAAALILLVGACDSSSEEATPQQPTASSSKDPAPTATVPTMPAQAAEDSSEGAAAFVKYYVDVFNYAAATGDVDELSRLSSPDCEGCQSYIDLYRATYEAGGYFRGGDWKIGDLKVKYEASETYLTTEMVAGSSRYREDERSPEKRDPGDQSTLSFGATRTSDSWQVSQLGLGAVQ
jgi:hypothetical protein